MSGPLLVFGAGGQLGREVLARAASAGRAVYGLARSEADIADAAAVAAVVARIRPSFILNAAAYTGVDKAETEAAAARAANVAGAANVARAAAALDVPLVHVSTDYVFDGTKSEPYHEGDALAPLGVYGRTKADGEAAVREIAGRHVILRTAWVYGIYGANFLKTMLRLARTHDRLRVVADQVGCPTATRDIAAAVFAVADATAPAWGTYHFAGTGSTSWHGFAEAIVTAAAPGLGRAPPVDAIAAADYPTPARRPANSRLDSSAFAAAFGVRAAPWRQRAEETVATLLQQEDKIA